MYPPLSMHVSNCCENLLKDFSSSIFWESLCWYLGSKVTVRRPFHNHINGFFASGCVEIQHFDDIYMGKFTRCCHFVLRKANVFYAINNLNCHLLICLCIVAKPNLRKCSLREFFG